VGQGDEAPQARAEDPLLDAGWDAAEEGSGGGQEFRRDEFGAKHRYAMVLHTDEPHPHVHMVVRAMGFDGRRLNIRKDTLREWRREFARHLREQGVPANATERAVRGVTQARKTDGIYRAGLRGVSTHWRQRAEAVARGLASGQSKVEPAQTRLLETRRDIVRDG